MDYVVGMVMGVVLAGFVAGIAWHYAECLKEKKKDQRDADDRAYRWHCETDVRMSETKRGLKALQDRVSVIETTEIAKGILTQGIAPTSSLQAEG